MLRGITWAALSAPRRMLAVAGLILIASAIFGAPVAGKLSAGGFNDPGSESARAARILVDKFGQSDQQMLITVTDADGATSDRAASVGIAIVEQLRTSPWVYGTSSTWTNSPGLVSTDGRSGLVIAELRGGENNAQHYAKSLLESMTALDLYDRDGVTVAAGGEAVIYAQINEQNQHDLLVMEAIAVPLSFLVLVWVFGGLVAAALPLAVAAVAIVGSMTILRVITAYTDVSIFALNLTTAMGLALAIDYTLLIISRYRDELATGAAPDAALTRTMVTAGRTVLFSATTVALSMAFMVLFPMYFLKSFAYAGVATVAFVACAAIVLTPALIVVLGARLDALDMHRLARRLLSRGEPEPKPVEQQFWHRSTTAVIRHAVPVAVAGVTVLVLLGTPFLGVKWGFPDDRALPRSASAHQVGDRLRTGFADDSSATISAVVPEAAGLAPGDLERYAAALSAVTHVSAVTAPTATFVNGQPAGPPAAPTGLVDGFALVTIASTAPLFSADSDDQLDQLHQIAGPAGKTVLFAGLAQNNRDSVAAITSRLPLVLGLIAAITFVLLFLLTGSVVLPVKALVLNVLSLTAAFGALVWIFQDGHFGAFGTTPTGTLVANMPVLLFCVAFGLSMDYEVFLIARIREYWLASGRAPADNDASVALGLARTGRVITAAALVMSISFAALIAAHVSFMRMFGVGLTLAVLTDATLVRTVLVPAFMHLMGRANWWAPGLLARLHDRVGLSEDHTPEASAAERHRRSGHPPDEPVFADGADYRGPVNGRPTPRHARPQSGSARR